MTNIKIIADSNSAKLRIDKYLAENLTDLSRNYIQKLIDQEQILVNDIPCRSKYQVFPGDIISIDIPDSVDPEIIPENIPLDILYEDTDIIVVNKPKGMVVHPAAGHYTGTLVNALMYHCSDLSGINGILRPGIVHRIDKDTSGVLVACKNDFAHRSLADQLKIHSITRKYNAVVTGTFKEAKGTIRGAIGRKTSDRKLMGINEKSGKPAITHYKVLESFKSYTYVECQLETGRTHQIRVHMAYIHHPVLGDIAYGGKTAAYKLNGIPLEGQTLHARVLGFEHPRTGKYMEFEAELPEYFTELLEKLRKNG